MLQRLTAHVDIPLHSLVRESHVFSQDGAYAWAYVSTHSDNAGNDFMAETIDSVMDDAPLEVARASEYVLGTCAVANTTSSKQDLAKTVLRHDARGLGETIWHNTTHMHTRHK